MSRNACVTMQMLATGLVAYLSNKLGVTFYLLGLLLALMVIDYLSGMAASRVEALEHPTIRLMGGVAARGRSGSPKKWLICL